MAHWEALVSLIWWCIFKGQQQKANKFLPLPRKPAASPLSDISFDILRVEDTFSSGVLRYFCKCFEGDNCHLMVRIFPHGRALKDGYDLWWRLLSTRDDMLLF